MIIKYEARIFDTAKGHTWKEFLMSDPFAFAGRYRIDLIKIDKNGEEHEVAYEFVTFKHRIEKRIMKMMDKQRGKYRTGQIGKINVELDV